ncbi:hypothetical protein TCAL_16300 [Tigriopus californicus]|uniref:Uncharacterized protein n=1 Tax=Tigriopus californicus TaxID=6832 RepID=A0A553N9N9_TIGCA|nr:hypothetical protein TCAL_16300 [Tigriopus californicus]
MGLFSLFNIVTFTNDACITTGAGNLGGTCFTSSECNAKGGSASGNCAADLCQIRLDFDSLITQDMTNGACGTTADAVRVSSPFSSSANAFPPTICGTLTGQHSK